MNTLVFDCLLSYKAVNIINLDCKIHISSTESVPFVLVAKLL